MFASVLCACAATRLNPPSGSIGGLAATQSRVVLPAQQEVRVAINVTYVLPAGEYRPVMENDAGIYYESPSKVFMRENFLGMQLRDKPFDGGIYLERAAPQVAKIYVTVPVNQGGEIQRLLSGGRPAKPILPREPIVFELKRR